MGNCKGGKRKQGGSVSLAGTWKFCILVRFHLERVMSDTPETKAVPSSQDPGRILCDNQLVIERLMLTSVCMDMK